MNVAENVSTECDEYRAADRTDAMPTTIRTARERVRRASSDRPAPKPTRLPAMMPGRERERELRTRVTLLRPSRGKRTSPG